MNVFRISVLLSVWLVPVMEAGEISFNRDIRPILSENCFHCHGPDGHGRKADLRLDTEEGAYAAIDGVHPIVPGKPEKSEVFHRIMTDDEDELMPPPDSIYKLSATQKQLIGDWIKQGAGYEGHWSFLPPKAGAHGMMHEVIDRYVEERLSDEGLRMAKRANRETLIRRLSLDLRGLPPTISEIESFLNDSSPDAYEKLVNMYLASPESAERLALDWLDASRYADTNGYSIDDHRDMWGWRDWVIHAFMKNKPYDEFVVEQLAGDLLPGATDLQKMATGFLRNSMNTHEGGTIPEEYRVAYIADKIDTVSTVFLGLTMKCAQCHDHKYDPLTMKDYYRMFAFFNSATEKGKGATNGNTKPFLKVKSPLLSQAKPKDVLEARLKRIQELEANPSLVTDGTDPEKVDASAEASGKGFQKKLQGKQPLAVRLKKSLSIERGIIEKQLTAPDETTVMIMDMPGKNEAPMLIRGEYHNKGEVVQAGVPAIFQQLPEGQPANRLSLARWMVDGKNPLTARVAVNRYWQMLLGQGIVNTSEDFGSQGQWPSHPELLDTLAVMFVESDWNIRLLLKEIVMSKSYQQQSDFTPELKERDPYNALLARAPRFRLQAEFVRDNALAIGGLLDKRIGGPSVYPSQPDGLWRQVSHFGYGTFTAQAYYKDDGPFAMRRSMYTFWKRTAPPPAMTSFDAPTRETCTVRRLKTNTPLQALVLLNDPQFLNAARGLGQRMLTEGGDTLKGRLIYGFRLATARKPNPDELAILMEAYDREKSRFEKHPEDLNDLLGALVEEERSVELAAASMAASIILNLSETITRQ